MRRSAASAVVDLDFRRLAWENDPHGGAAMPTSVPSAFRKNESSLSRSLTTESSDPWAAEHGLFSR